MSTALTTTGVDTDTGEPIMVETHVTSLDLTHEVMTMMLES